MLRVIAYGEKISLLRQTFPEAFLMYRTTTAPFKPGNKDAEAIVVFQLNQSAKTLMRLLRVPLFHWADLARGNNERRDDYHYRQDCKHRNFTQSHSTSLLGEIGMDDC